MTQRAASARAWMTVARGGASCHQERSQLRPARNQGQGRLLSRQCLAQGRAAQAASRGIRVWAAS